jgi:hypothetical protein
LQTFTYPVAVSGGPSALRPLSPRETAALHRLKMASQLIEEAGQMLWAAAQPQRAEALLELSLQLSDLEMDLRGAAPAED